MKDRVDLALSDCQRLCPDQDPTAGGIEVRLMLLGRLIEHDVAASLEACDLQLWEFDVLATLRRAPSSCRLSAGELARRMLLTGSGMTHRITRLERRGLVLRDSDPNDRRGVLVDLTDAGRERVDQAVGLRCGEAEKLLADFGDDERRHLEALLRRLLVGLERPSA